MTDAQGDERQLVGGAWVDTSMPGRPMLRWEEGDTEPAREASAAEYVFWLEIERLWGLLTELVDPGPCQYDHNGLCQAHHLDERPCPHGRAKLALGMRTTGGTP
jgi:hypothetical protein